MKLLWATITLIVASLLVPNFVLAQPGARSAGRSSSSSLGTNPGPPWTMRPSIERAAGLARPAAIAPVTTTEMTRSEMTEDAENRLLDKKIKSICRGC